jgi:hypothetical protein
MSADSQVTPPRDLNEELSGGHSDPETGERTPQDSGQRGQAAPSYHLPQ